MSMFDPKRVADVIPTDEETRARRARLGGAQKPNLVSIAPRDRLEVQPEDGPEDEPSDHLGEPFADPASSKNKILERKARDVRARAAVDRINARGRRAHGSMFSLSEVLALLNEFGESEARRAAKREGRDKGARKNRGDGQKVRRNTIHERRIAVDTKRALAELVMHAQAAIEFQIKNGLEIDGGLMKSSQMVQKFTHCIDKHYGHPLIRDYLETRPIGGPKTTSAPDVVQLRNVTSIAAQALIFTGTPVAEAAATVADMAAKMDVAEIEAGQIESWAEAIGDEKRALALAYSKDPKLMKLIEDQLWLMAPATKADDPRIDREKKDPPAHVDGPEAA